jgi:hypothetical protein
MSKLRLIMSAASHRLKRLLKNLLRLGYRRYSAAQNPHVRGVHSGFSPPRAIFKIDPPGARNGFFNSFSGPLLADSEGDPLTWPAYSSAVPWERGTEGDVLAYINFLGTEGCYGLRDLFYLPSETIGLILNAPLSSGCPTQQASGGCSQDRGCSFAGGRSLRAPGLIAPSLRKRVLPSPGNVLPISGSWDCRAELFVRIQNLHHLFGGRLHV